VLPHMIGRRSGHIINVSSGAGLLTSPGSGCYCATKFAVVGMTEVLRAEVARLGIGVTLVCPAFVKTPIFEVTKTKGLRQFDMTKAIKYWGQRPETTAKLIVKGIKKNTGLLIPTIDGKLLYSFKRFFPGLYQAAGPLVARQFGKLREEG
jgi:short-subunit dehydrogenase